MSHLRKFLPKAHDLCLAGGLGALGYGLWGYDPRLCSIVIGAILTAIGLEILPPRELIAAFRAASKPKDRAPAGGGI